MFIHFPSVSLLSPIGNHFLPPPSDPSRTGNKFVFQLKKNSGVLMLSCSMFSVFKFETPFDNHIANWPWVILWKLIPHKLANVRNKDWHKLVMENWKN